MWIAADALVSTMRSASRAAAYLSRIQALTVFPDIGMSLGIVV